MECSWSRICRTNSCYPGFMQTSQASQAPLWASCLAAFTSCGAERLRANASFLTSFLSASIHYRITLVGECICAGRPARESITDNMAPVSYPPGRGKGFSRATATAVPNSIERAYNTHTHHIFIGDKKKRFWTAALKNPDIKINKHKIFEDNKRL